MVVAFLYTVDLDAGEIVKGVSEPTEGVDRVDFMVVRFNGEVVAEFETVGDFLFCMRCAGS